MLQRAIEHKPPETGFFTESAGFNEINASKNPVSRHPRDREKKLLPPP
jgi:hypothetical protein